MGRGAGELRDVGVRGERTALRERELEDPGKCPGIVRAPPERGGVLRMVA